MTPDGHLEFYVGSPPALINFRDPRVGFGIAKTVTVEDRSHVVSNIEAIKKIRIGLGYCSEFLLMSMTQT